MNMKTDKPNFLILLICFLAFSFNTATAQTYDPYAVQVINNLIANGNICAVPDTPETWEFAKWNDETPKQLIDLRFGWYAPHGPLRGDVSLSGLTTLKSLDCWDNSVAQLDVSNCTQLQNLYCFVNIGLNKLDVKGCINLQTLKCFSCSLTKLDLSDCTALENLECSGNSLSNLDLTSCPNLVNLRCSNNKLSKLDVTKLTQLKELICENINICELNLTKSTQLETLDCSDNSLNELNIVEYSQLKTIYCKSNNISTLDITNCTQLKNLRCDNNNLKELNLSQCNQINVLACNNNYITKLDLTNLTLLQFFECNNNNLLELDLSNCTQLIYFLCEHNNFIELDLTNCEKLQTLKCAGNRLTELDLSKHCNLLNFDCSSNHLYELKYKGTIPYYYFNGSSQEVSLALTKNEQGIYSHSIELQSPIFSNTAINYDYNKHFLLCKDSIVTSTYFSVHVIGNHSLQISGTMNFTYSNVGVETQEKIKLKVYPNPATNILFIECDNLNTVKLYDMHGREMVSQNGNDKTEINISHLPKGIYIVAVFSEGKLMGNAKIVKQ